MLFPGLHRISWAALELHRRVGYEYEGPAPVEEMARAVGIRFRFAAIDVAELETESVGVVDERGELEVVISAELSDPWRRFVLARNVAGAALYCGALTGAPLLDPDLRHPWQGRGATTIGASFLLAPSQAVEWALRAAGFPTLVRARGVDPREVSAVAEALAVPETIARDQIRRARQGLSVLTTR